MPAEARLMLLDRAAVEQLLPAQDAMDAVHEAFLLHGRDEGRNFPVVREQLATGGVFGIKSGDVPSQSLLGFKAAGFWPRNREVGGEPHQATILLIDPATGRPLCVIDGNIVTTLRTGAAGAIGLQSLARPDSRRATVFGTGVQATVQLAFALRVLPHLRHVRYVTHDRQPNAEFEARFRSDCTLEFTGDANGAVADSDVVITATPGQGALFAADAVRPGTHLNCVGSDTRGKRELPDGLLERARLVVDDREQALRLGELQWAPATHCDQLGDLLSGRATFARSPDDVTVFDMTGLSLQDLTTARLVYRRALDTGAGVQVPWPW
jgi:alanine dehydrogenase